MKSQFDSIHQEKAFLMVLLTLALNTTLEVASRKPSKFPTGTVTLKFVHNLDSGMVVGIFQGPTGKEYMLTSDDVGVVEGYRLNGQSFGIVRKLDNVDSQQLSLREMLKSPIGTTLEIASSSSGMPSGLFVLQSTKTLRHGTNVTSELLSIKNGKTYKLSSNDVSKVQGFRLNGQSFGNTDRLNKLS